MLKREDISEATARRFWEKVRRGRPDECWPWEGATNSSGYGVIGWGPRGQTKCYLAHRVSFVLAGGILVPELTLDHTCECRPCVNDAHLEQVTQRENNYRAHAWPKTRKTVTCSTEGHTGDILAAATPEDVRKILDSLASPAGFEPASPT